MLESQQDGPYLQGIDLVDLNIPLKGEGDYPPGMKSA